MNAGTLPKMIFSHLEYNFAAQQLFIGQNIQHLTLPNPMANGFMPSIKLL